MSALWRAVSLFGAVLMLGCPATARSREAPSVAVVGVARNDVLNLRAEPDPRASVIASLAAGATDISVVAQATQSLDWVMVEKGRARGWANAQYLAYGQPQDGMLPVRLRCAGTEPFWGIETGYGLADADLAFAQRRARLALAAPIRAAGRPDLWLLPSAGPREPDSFLLVERRVCSDGMSDRRYPFAVSVRLAERLLAGCCR